MIRRLRLVVLLVAVWAVALPGGPVRAQQEETPKRAEENAVRPPTIAEMLLFFPLKFPAGDWKPAGLRFTDVVFTAEDRTRLHGWYCPCDRPRAVILISHGNAGNISFLAPWLKYLQSTMRVSTFAFDYRGYGKSEGVPTVEGALQDARAARANVCELAGVKESQLLL